MDELLGDIEGWTCHHPPNSLAVVTAHEEVRAATRTFMIRLVQVVPDGPELRQALGEARHAMFLANAAVAIRHPDNG